MLTNLPVFLSATSRFGLRQQHARGTAREERLFPKEDWMLEFFPSKTPFLRAQVSLQLSEQPQASLIELEQEIRSRHRASLCPFS